MDCNSRSRSSKSVHAAIPALHERNSHPSHSPAKLPSQNYHRRPVATHSAWNTLATFSSLAVALLASRRSSALGATTVLVSMGGSLGSIPSISPPPSSPAGSNAKDSGLVGVRLPTSARGTASGRCPPPPPSSPPPSCSSPPLTDPCADPTAPTAVCRLAELVLWPGTPRASPMGHI